MSSFLSAVGGVLQDPFGNVQAARQGRRGQREALEAQTAEAQRSREFLQQQAERGVSAIQEGGAGAAAALRTGQAGQLEQLAGGEAAQVQALSQGFGQAQGQLQDLTGLRRFEAGATTPLQATAFQAAQVGGPGAGAQTLEQLRGVPGLFQGFEQGPGFQQEIAAGEQAINRASSAQGGRFSGRTLQALQRSGQDIASRRFGEFAQRRLAQAQLGGGLAQTADALAQQRGLNVAGRQDVGGLDVARRQDVAGLTAQQAQFGLAQQGIGAQRGLANVFGQQGLSLADILGQGARGRAGVIGGTQGGLAELLSSGGRAQANIFQGLGAGAAGISAGLGRDIGAFGAGAGQVGQARAGARREVALGLASLV